MVWRRGGTWHILVGWKQGMGAELSQQLQAQMGGASMIGGLGGALSEVRGLGGTLSMKGGRGQASSVEGGRRRALALERGM